MLNHASVACMVKEAALFQSTGYILLTNFDNSSLQSTTSNQIHTTFLPLTTHKKQTIMAFELTSGLFWMGVSHLTGEDYCDNQVDNDTRPLFQLERSNSEASLNSTSSLRTDFHRNSSQQNQPSMDDHARAVRHKKSE